MLIGYQLCPSKMYRAVSVLIGWIAFVVSVDFLLKVGKDDEYRESRVPTER